jgi:hypothetical protein
LKTDAVNLRDGIVSQTCPFFLLGYKSGKCKKIQEQDEIFGFSDVHGQSYNVLFNLACKLFGFNLLQNKQNDSGLIAHVSGSSQEVQGSWLGR